MPLEVPTVLRCSTQLISASNPENKDRQQGKITLGEVFNLPVPRFPHL